MSAPALRPVPVPDPRLEALRRRYGAAGPRTLMQAMIQTEFPTGIAAVSSFGAESAVLLHMIAEVLPSLPVLFVDTGRHFPETQRYRDRLVARLGLTDVREVSADRERLQRVDAAGTLCSEAPDLCCFVRKVEPALAALAGFDAWISGVKRYHGPTRSGLANLERDTAGRIKVNPLAHLHETDLEAHFRRHDLPRHPLVADGFRSIGCAPCTDPVAGHETPRAGRWRGRDKTECGLHCSAPAGI